MITTTAIPAFNDNYHWLIESEVETWVVDPGDGDKVQEVLAERSRTLTGILITHHHWDHINGIETLLHPDLIVAGPARDQHPLVNRPMQEGDTLAVCGSQFQVFEVPGHTLNHIVYYAEPENQDPILFSGDTLFAGGCGRLFEGTPAQMHQSLSKLGTLPERTQIYCAHEYTLGNLEFANTIEPNNPDLNSRLETVKDLRAQGIPTIPSILSLELKTNPFMRIHSAELTASAKRSNPDLKDPISIFAEIRSLKDQF